MILPFSPQLFRVSQAGSVPQPVPVIILYGES